MSVRPFPSGHAARRTRAKAEADRLVTLSPDLIVVAGFDGYFKRVNPAFVARPYRWIEWAAAPVLEERLIYRSGAT